MIVVKYITIDEMLKRMSAIKTQWSLIKCLNSHTEQQLISELQLQSVSIDKIRSTLLLFHKFKLSFRLLDKVCSMFMLYSDCSG